MQSRESEGRVICQLGRYIIFLKNVSASNNGTHTLMHTGTHTLHAWKQPVLTVWSKLPPLCLECSWRDRRQETRWSVRGAISYTFTETTGRSITNTCPHTPALTSHISCLAPVCSTNKKGEVWKKALNLCSFPYARCIIHSKQGTLLLAASSHQTGSDWSIKRLESRWPMQGCCSTSFIINSLLYWLCIHLEGKRRRADVWGSYISQRFPSSPVSYLASCWDTGRMQDEPFATLIWESERCLSRNKLRDGAWQKKA